MCANWRCAYCLVFFAAMHISPEAVHREPQTSKLSPLDYIVAKGPTTFCTFKSQHFYHSQTSPTVFLCCTYLLLILSLHYQPVPAGPTQFTCIIVYLFPDHPGEKKWIFSLKLLQILSWIEEEGDRSDFA